MDQHRTNSGSMYRILVCNLSVKYKMQEFVAVLLLKKQITEAADLVEYSKHHVSGLVEERCVISNEMYVYIF